MKRRCQVNVERLEMRQCAASDMMVDPELEDVVSIESTSTYMMDVSIDSTEVSIVPMIGDAQADQYLAQVDLEASIKECNSTPDQDAENECQNTDSSKTHVFSVPIELIDELEDREAKWIPTGDIVKPNSLPKADAEYIPTIGAVEHGFVPRPASSMSVMPPPSVAIDRPQLFGLPQLSIDRLPTINSMSLGAVGEQKAIVSTPQRSSQSSPMIDLGNVQNRAANHPPLASAPLLSEMKTKDKALSDAANISTQQVPTHQARLRRGIEALRPLIAQLPWIAPPRKVPTVVQEDRVAENNKPSENNLASETTEVEPTDASRSPSDRAPKNGITEKHTKTQNEKSTSQETMGTKLFLRLDFLLPGFVGMTLGARHWENWKRRRDKLLVQRPVKVDDHVRTGGDCAPDDSKK